MLYLVPTPIGNLEDMSPRAIETLKSVQLILAEDTRNSGRLLKHFSIETPMQSFHAHNEHSSLDSILKKLKNGADIAVISDAGAPGISDPGFLLSRACREQDIEIISLPGPTALIPALTSSGLPADSFTFHGFLPAKKGRNTALEEIAENPYTNILYESPYRVAKTIRQLSEVCGKNRAASVSKEISKLHESHFKGTLEELSIQFPEESKYKGEYVIVVEGKK